MQTHNSPIKAIREKCLECSCGQAYEVRITECRDDGMCQRT